MQSRGATCEQLLREAPGHRTELERILGLQMEQNRVLHQQLETQRTNEGLLTSEISEKSRELDDQEHVALRASVDMRESQAREEPLRQSTRTNQIIEYTTTYTNTMS